MFEKETSKYIEVNYGETLNFFFLLIAEETYGGGACT